MLDMADALGRSEKRLSIVVVSLDYVLAEKILTIEAAGADLTIIRSLIEVATLMVATVANG